MLWERAFSKRLAPLCYPAFGKPRAIDHFILGLDVIASVEGKIVVVDSSPLHNVPASHLSSACCGKGSLPTKYRVSSPIVTVTTLEEFAVACRISLIIFSHSTEAVPAPFFFLLLERCLLPRPSETRSRAEARLTFVPVFL